MWLFRRAYLFVTLVSSATGTTVIKQKCVRIHEVTTPLLPPEIVEKVLQHVKIESPEQLQELLRARHIHRTWESSVFRQVSIYGADIPDSALDMSNVMRFLFLAHKSPEWENLALVVLKGNPERERIFPFWDSEKYVKRILSFAETVTGHTEWRALIMKLLGGPDGMLMNTPRLLALRKVEGWDSYVRAEVLRLSASRAGGSSFLDDAGVRSLLRAADESPEWDETALKVFQRAHRAGMKFSRVGGTGIQQLRLHGVQHRVSHRWEAVKMLVLRKIKQDIEMKIRHMLRGTTRLYAPVDGINSLDSSDVEKMLALRHVNAFSKASMNHLFEGFVSSYRVRSLDAGIIRELVQHLGQTGSARSNSWEDLMFRMLQKEVGELLMSIKRGERVPLPSIVKLLPLGKVNNEWGAIVLQAFDRRMRIRDRWSKVFSRHGRDAYFAAHKLENMFFMKLSMDAYTIPSALPLDQVPPIFRMREMDPDQLPAHLDKIRLRTLHPNERTSVLEVMHAQSVHPEQIPWELNFGLRYIFHLDDGLHIPTVTPGLFEALDIYAKREWGAYFPDDAETTEVTFRDFHRRVASTIWENDAMPWEGGLFARFEKKIRFEHRQDVWDCIDWKEIEKNKFKGPNILAVVSNPPFFSRDGNHGGFEYLKGEFKITGIPTSYFKGGNSGWD